MENFLGEDQLLTQCPNCKRDHDSVLCPFCEKEQENDRVLVRQKDYIINLINNRRFSEARSCLTVLCELWTKHDYKYKYDELIQRIRSSPREVED